MATAGGERAVGKQAGAWAGAGFPALCCSRGPQCPAVLVAVEPEDREPGPVEGPGPGEEVGGDAGQAAGAGLPAAPGPAGEVGDLALDDGPVRFVALLPGWVALGGAGALQHRFVGVDGDGAPAPGRGAAWPQWAGGAPGAERGPAAAAGGGDDDGGLPGRAGHGPRAQVHGEAVLGKPPGGVAGWRAFDGDGEAGGFQAGAG